MKPLHSPNPPFEGEVRGLSSEGLGVVEHPEGRVYFVPGVWPGDRGVFRILSHAKNYGYAELETLIKPSGDRVAPACPHQGVQRGQCGGCSWMIGSYPSQLKHKEHRVRYALTRAKLISEGDPRVMRSIWGSPSWGYRNRAQFKTDGDRLGYVSEESRVLAPIQDCLVLNEKMRALLKRQLETLPQESWRPSDEHVWSFLELDDQMALDEKPRPNVRRSFRQGNSQQNERMKAWLREKIVGEKSRSVAELFCGSGNFTEVFVDQGFTVRAYEVSSLAIEELQRRFEGRVEAEALDLFHPAGRRVAIRRVRDCEILFLDPPRAGAKGIEEFARHMPTLKKIYYVSCDLATCVRDLVALSKVGCRLLEVQPLDMFPHTPHVELLCELDFGVLASD